MLQAKNINVTIGATPILSGIDFRARSGQITAIVGPNGSGKTTFLKALTGDLPYEGHITLDHEDITDIDRASLASRRAVLSQGAGLAFPFTALEVVRLGLIASLDAHDCSLPSRALARVGLAGYEARFYHELSGGEQQRCHLARVLVQVWQPVRGQTPSWLFLDEPVSALDIGHQLEVMSIASSFAQAGGGVIAVMHDLNLTSMFSDSILLIKEGRALVQGDASEVLTDENLTRAYGCQLRVNHAPAAPQSAPFLLPQSAILPAGNTRPI